MPQYAWSTATEDNAGWERVARLEQPGMISFATLGIVDTSSKTMQNHRLAMIKILKQISLRSLWSRHFGSRVRWGVQEATHFPVPFARDIPAEQVKTPPHFTFPRKVSETLNHLSQRLNHLKAHGFERFLKVRQRLDSKNF